MWFQYRRNSDEEYRRIMREYKKDPSNIELLFKLNRIRKRIGKMPLSEISYGALAFYWLHHGDQVPKLTPSEEAELNSVIGTQYGLSIENIPEAKQIYLELCQKYNVEPEACDPPTQQKYRRNSDTKLRQLEQQIKQEGATAENLLKLATDLARSGKELTQYLEIAQFIYEGVKTAEKVLPEITHFNYEYYHRELSNRIKLFESYVLNRDNYDIRRATLRIGQYHSIIDQITIEWGEDSTEILSNDFGGDTCSRVEFNRMSLFEYNDYSFNNPNETLDTPASLTRGEVEEIWDYLQGGAIVQHSDSGFIYVGFYPTLEELNNVWNELEADFYPEDEDEEDEEDEDY